MNALGCEAVFYFGSRRVGCCGSVREQDGGDGAVASVELLDEFGRAIYFFDVDLGVADALGVELLLQAVAVAAPVVENMVMVPESGVKSTELSSVLVVSTGDSLVSTVTCSPIIPVRPGIGVTSHSGLVCPWATRQTVPMCGRYVMARAVGICWLTLMPNLKTRSPSRNRGM